MKLKVANWIYKHLATKWCGSEIVPLQNDSLVVCVPEMGIEEVIAFRNDSFEIGLGYPESWHHFYRRETFAKLCWWFIWKHYFCDWFGVRRKLWYWALLAMRLV